MTYKYALTVLAGVGLLVSSCSIFGSGDPDYWPMAEGNCWHFRDMTIRTPPDSASDTTVFEDATVWRCCDKETMDDGEQAWAVDVGDGDTAFFRETGDAVLVYASRSETEPDTWLCFPLEQGRVWEYGNSAMVVRGKETVSVPAGTYRNCWKVQLLGLLDQDFDFHTWFAPDVGMVKTEMAIESEGYSYVSRLELTEVDLE